MLWLEIQPADFLDTMDCFQAMVPLVLIICLDFNIGITGCLKIFTPQLL